MIYKDFHGLKLSALGMGAMRLPVTGADASSPIDEAAAAEMVEYAIKHGINYFDTAYGYHEGKSEIVMGKILAKYPRESFYLASKFPGFDLDKVERPAEIFEEQLKKCNVEYFDFYLFHNVCDRNIDWYLDPKYGIMDYLLKQKEAGRIRHLGFSAHASLEDMKRFLDAYSEHLEFVQIQLNYLDWKLQQAKEKVDLIRSYNLPVWVMEPVRGGKLAALSGENTKKLQALRPDRKAPEWAFRFLQTIPEVTMTLSGMSNMQQLQDNIQTYETLQPLNEEEMTVLQEVADSMMNILPCTSCRYCVSECQQELDIPTLMNLYNDTVFETTAKDALAKAAALPAEKQPSSCVGCRSCEQKCPQKIRISEVMTALAEKMG